MSSEHEHAIVERLRDLRRKLVALPPGSEADDARAAMEALVAALGVAGYDLRGV